MTTASAKIPITAEDLIPLKRSGLTDRQAEILTFLWRYTLAHGYQPNYRAILDRFGFRSLNALKSHFVALTRKGWIEPPCGESRAIRFKRCPSGAKFLGFRAIEETDTET